MKEYLVFEKYGEKVKTLRIKAESEDEARARYVFHDIIHNKEMPDAIKIIPKERIGEYI